MAIAAWGCAAAARREVRVCQPWPSAAAGTDLQGCHTLPKDTLPACHLNNTDRFDV